MRSVSTVASARTSYYTRALHRLLAGVLGVASLTRIASAQTLPVPGAPMNVLIIAVSEYDDDHWKNPILQKNIKATGDELAAFFGKQFPHANIVPLTSREDTTTQHLTSVLR